MERENSSASISYSFFTGLACGFMFVFIIACFVLLILTEPENINPNLPKDFSVMILTSFFLLILSGGIKLFTNLIIIRSYLLFSFVAGIIISLIYIFIFILNHPASPL